MLSISYELSVPGFTRKEIGYAAFVRAHQGNLHLGVTNDGGSPLSKISVRPVLESYAGQGKPMLFQWREAQVIESVPANGMASLEFQFWPVFPGVVSVAVHVTDAAKNVVMAKRKESTAYEQAPVRWWFHVIDDISIETLRALRVLASGTRKGVGK